MLHLATRAPILVAVAVRTGPLRYEIHAVGPLHSPRTGDREKDCQAITQAITTEIENLARAHPEQYLWGHRRWKGTESPPDPVPAPANL
jgi:lauroyl/myristoyl acyltransferase